VSLHVGQLVDRNRRESQLGHRCFEPLAHIRRITSVLMMNEPAVELLVADLEGILSRAHLHIFHLYRSVASVVVSVVIDDETGVKRSCDLPLTPGVAGHNTIGNFKYRLSVTRTVFTCEARPSVSPCRHKALDR